MSSVHNDVRDNGLQVIVDDCDLFVICSQEPTTYAQAFNEDTSSGYRLGSKVPTIALQNRTGGGREARLTAFSDGTIEDSGGSTSGMFWACIDTATSRLLSAGPLTNDQVVVDGQFFAITADFAVAYFGTVV